MNREDVREYIQHSESIFESSPQMDEANTKAAVLRDFLDLLGWTIPTNTKLEYPVEAFGRTYKVDYALILEENPSAFIEAKGIDTPLTAKHGKQLSSYMTNKNVNYGILTNGKQYRFFQRQVNADNVSVAMIGNVELQNLRSRYATLEAYTSDFIESEESGVRLNRINELQQARETLRDKKDEISADLTNLLIDWTSDNVSSLAESQSKEMIDGLIENIESEVYSNGTGPTPSVDDDGETVIEPTRNDIVGRIRRAEIEGEDDAQVAVFPSKESGLPFLKENNAWGFVRVGRDFDYVAMYITGDGSAVRYFATVKDVVPPDEAELVRPAEEYVDRAKIGEGKMVVRFETGTLYELEDPVPYETKYPQSLQYTTLEALRSAETTDDML
jgi:hypothetical protein